MIEQIDREALEKKALAMLRTGPVIHPDRGAAQALQSLMGGPLDHGALQGAIADLTGDDGIEAIQKHLAVQALTLSGFANQWLSIAAKQTDPEFLERIAAIALKAQNQSRKTLQTLAEMKNPKRSTFIKNQQNVLVTDPPLPQLNHHEQPALDTGTTGKTKTTDFECEALGEINRPGNS